MLRVAWHYNKLIALNMQPSWFMNLHVNMLYSGNFDLKFKVHEVHVMNFGLRNMIKDSKTRRSVIKHERLLSENTRRLRFLCFCEPWHRMKWFLCLFIFDCVFDFDLWQQIAIIKSSTIRSTYTYIYVYISSMIDLISIWRRWWQSDSQSWF